ncbi:MFS general substrate transporter [Lentinula raphanica]|uniref:MFS general substrate transporter n=1 Tax=Lentinula raphanica TaxID=153919 RepID=A0AA38P053_9AGAR|nr:MFS general substrate transporter [Lentinula raphanica]KAJ3833853.1 MFS general substrate transporter [Lentinula raphanica]
MDPPAYNEKRDPDADFDRHVELSASAVDTGAQFAIGSEGSIDHAEAIRIRRKIDRNILPMMCLCFESQNLKSAAQGFVSSQEAHLTTDQYNWLGTIFYLSYLVFEYPQNLALQRFPVGKWMSINIFVWSVALCSHAACKSFGGLFAVRFILGICEGSITAGFMIVSSMFYTRKEQTLRVGYWFLMNGTAQIILAFVAYGSLHITKSKLEPWQWLMLITGLLTFVLAVCFWFFFPDSPTNAWFLTPKERALAVQRIKSNQTGVENKHFKKEQMIEAFLEPKTWLFFIFSIVDNIPNSLTNQGTIIISSFGFTTLQTTLLGCVSGVVEIATIWSGVEISARIPNSRAYVGSIYFLPSLLGVFLVNLLPWSDQVGLLFAVWLGTIQITAFVMSLAWVSATTAGHTKKVTMNAIMLCGYCIGNAVGPFMWQEKYKPRNHVPWIVIGVCYVVSIILLMIIRAHLALENKRRDAEPLDTTYDDVYIELKKDGVLEKVKVEKEFLDLTDVQNRDFRYVL